MAARTDTCSTLPLAARRHGLVGDLDAAFNRLAIDPGGAVIACSGGADSTALLLATSVIAHRRAQVQGSEPHVVYVHHHLRSEADQEAQDVAALADRIGFSFRCVDIEPARQAGSLGAAARDLRYGALVTEATRVGAQAILTAHHADDQLETMLMSLGRGTGASGMSGMTQRRILAQTDSGPIELVRPLLHVTHDVLCEFCTVAEVSWCQDQTNLDPKNPRIRMRSEVTPVLEAMWPGAARRTSVTAEILEQAALALQEKVEQVFGPPQVTRWARTALADYPRVVLGMGLHRAAAHLGAPSVSQRQLLPAADAIRDQVRRPRQFNWEGGLHVHVTSQEVWISCEATRDV